MASVQELLLANEAKKSPFINLLEGVTQGIGQAQNQGLDRTIQLIQMQQQMEDRQRKIEQDKQIRERFGLEVNKKTNQAFKGVQKPQANGIPSLKLKEKITNKDGYLTSTYEIDEPEEKDAPSGYRYKQDGTLEAIPGGPADKNTEKDKTLTGIKADLAERYANNEKLSPREMEILFGKDEKPGGMQLTPNVILNVNEGAAVARQLPDVARAMEENKDLFGPIEGTFRSNNPYDETAQTLDALMRASSQAFGRFMEGGVLRKEDEEKYRRMFPKLGDKYKVAQNKLQVVKRLLSKKYESDRTTLGKSGYDISSLDILEIPDELFGTKKDRVSSWSDAEEEELRKLEKKYGGSGRD